MFLGADRGSGAVQADSGPPVYIWGLGPEAARTFVRIFKVFPFRLACFCPFCGRRGTAIRYIYS